jgi:hypothetical protein
MIRRNGLSPHESRHDGSRPFPNKRGAGEDGFYFAFAIDFAGLPSLKPNLEIQSRFGLDMGLSIGSTEDKSVYFPIWMP